ncbi:unnamed protein product [Cochlearia groenlandica]
MSSSTQQNPSNAKQEVLLQIPDCKVHLVDETNPLELASGEFKLVKLSENGQTLAMTVMVGHDFQCAVVKDEPHEEYKSVVAKAIAGGTGHIIKGIFTCSNSYSKKIHKRGGEIKIAKEAVENSDDASSEINGEENNETKKLNKANTNLQRVEKMWKASESIGAMVLDGEGMVTGSMIAPMVKSKVGKALLSSAPGEVLLASLDSFNKIIGAAEAAEIQTHSATTIAATQLVSKSFGAKAGKATAKMLETSGSLGRTAWKIQKVLNPSISISSEIAKNAPTQ